MEKVLITTWGNPFGWKHTTYEINGKPTKSRSTLPALIRELKPSRILVIVLDTLVNIQTCNNFDKETERCLETWPDPNEIPPKKVSNYEEVVKDVESRVKWYLWKLVEETIDDESSQELEKMLCNEKVKIVVAPGIGTYSNVVISGNATALDYYHYITYELSKWLPAGDATVYLDLTHGLNFMPVLTYRVVSNLLSLASYACAWSIEFIVFNAEPYMQGAKLKIHMIESVTVKPKPQHFVVPERSDWTAFISSVINGFLLVFAAFFPDCLEVEQYAHNIYTKFIKSIKINSKILNDHIEVEIYRDRLPEELYSIALLYYLVRVMNAKFGDVFPKKELTLHELENISELFYNIPAMGYRIEKDVENLESKHIKIFEYWETIGKLKWRNKWQRYTRVCKSGETQKDNQCIEVRNFIAHSGFDYNVVQMRKANSDVFIRYDPNLRDVVIELAVKSLEVGGNQK